MRKPALARTCGLGIATVLLVSSPAAAAPARENFAFLQNSSVRVITRYPGLVGYGTGWVATAADAEGNANNAVIVTAAHVVRGAARVTIVEANSREELEATVRAMDLNRDIAFIEVRNLRGGGVPLPVTSVPPPVGQPVFTTGYTTASDRPSQNELAEVSGVVSGTYSRSIPDPQPIWRYADVGVAQFQHAIPILPGFSGGPVIDNCGRVVGFNVNDGGHLALPGGTLNLATGVSFAIASTEIIKAAREAGVPLTVDRTPCTAAAPPPPASVPANQVPPQRAPEPEGWSLGTFLSGRTGAAAIAGLLGLIAFGVAGWFLLRPSRKPAVGGETVAVRESVTITPSRATGVLLGASGRTIGLTGRGPAGESVNLRFTADELASGPRSLGTEGKALVPDSRAKNLVSRTHAEISIEGGEFFIQDLKSTNGTEVDGDVLPPFEKRRLHNGAVIKLADVALTARIE
jgi:hypothetical protein